MGVKIKDIKGALVEKKKLTHEFACQESGYNEAITQQGEVAIGLNREKLAKRIFLSDKKGSDDIVLYDNYKNHYLGLADAIIANQKDLCEVVK